MLEEEDAEIVFEDQEEVFDQQEPTVPPTHNQGARTHTDRALDTINALHIENINDDNYSNSMENFKFMLDAADLMWTLNDPPTPTDRFEENDAPQLTKNVANVILSHISSSLRNKPALNVDMKPHEIVKQLQSFLATTSAATHDKLTDEAENIYCSNDKKGLQTFIQMHLKVRRKMLQANYPAWLPKTNQKPSNSWYRAFSNTIFMEPPSSMIFAGLPTEVRTMKERLENHVIMHRKRDSSKRTKGMRAPNSNVHTGSSNKIPDELFDLICRIVDKHVSCKNDEQRGRGRGRGRGNGHHHERAGKAQQATRLPNENDK